MGPIAFIHRHRLPLVIMLAAMLTYALTIRYGFVTLDDPLLVYENPAVVFPSPHAVFKAFTSYDPELYIPVTLLSYQIQSWLLGVAHAWHFHLINVLLHGVNAALVFSVVKRLSNRTVALIAGMLFAVHPLNVEAVAWISARKDLLSAFFFLAAWRVSLSDRRGMFVMASALFALALMSKVSAMTLPLVLLLSDAVQSGVRNIRWKRLTPLACLSAVFGIIAVIGKSHVVGGERPLALVLMSIRSTVLYLQIFLLPVHQSPVYPFLASPSLMMPVFWLSAAIIAAITAAAIFLRKRLPLFLFGWAFYLCTLWPSYVEYSHGGKFLLIGSDRYAYIPAIGLFLMASALIIGIYDLYRASLRLPMIAFTVAVLACLAGTSVTYAANWRDGIAFNRRILSLHPENLTAQYNLAVAYGLAGDGTAAEREYRKTMGMDPSYANAYINLATLIAKQGRTDEALSLLQQAVRVDETYFKTHYNLAVLKERLGRIDDAVAEYERAAQLQPDFIETRMSLGRLYGKKGRFAESIAQYEYVAKQDPEFANTLNMLKKQMRKPN